MLNNKETKTYTQMNNMTVADLANLLKTVGTSDEAPSISIKEMRTSFIKNSLETVDREVVTRAFLAEYEGLAQAVVDNVDNADPLNSKQFTTVQSAKVYRHLIGKNLREQGKEFADSIQKNGIVPEPTSAQIKATNKVLRMFGMVADDIAVKWMLNRLYGSGAFGYKNIGTKDARQTGYDTVSERTFIKKVEIVIAQALTGKVKLVTVAEKEAARKEREMARKIAKRTAKLAEMPKKDPTGEQATKNADTKKSRKNSQSK